MWAKQKGFTIVELLIVIVVIAILAAITIVAYNGIQSRAQDTTVTTDLANANKKMQLFYVDNNRYPNSVAELQTVGIDVSIGSYALWPTVAVNMGYCAKSDYSGYAFFAMTRSGNRFYIQESGSVKADTTGTTWDSATGTLGAQCSALGYTVNMTHGYVRTDTTTGPWRAWAGGN